MTYQHTGDNPTATPRVITFSAHDGAAASNTATSTVTVVPVNDSADGGRRHVCGERRRHA